MDSKYENKPIRALFKEKLNTWKDINKKRWANFARLSLCNNSNNNITHNCSISRRNKIQNFIRNRNISICSNYLDSNTQDGLKNRKLFSQSNESNKNYRGNKYKKIRPKFNKFENNIFLPLNRSLTYLNQKEKNRNDLSTISKINKNNKILYINNSPKVLILSEKNETSNNTMRNSQIIYIQKNNNFLGKTLIKSNDINEIDSSFNKNNEQTILYHNNLKNENGNNNYNKNYMNIAPYKKKRIMNKQFCNIRLNDYNEQKKMNPNECGQYSNNINNLEIYNILSNDQENIHNKKPKNFILDANINKIDQKCNSIDIKKINEDNSNSNNNFKKNMDIGIEENQYNVKNININFNNIKVVNNISKKYSSVKRERKRKFLSNDTNNSQTVILNNENETINAIKGSRNCNESKDRKNLSKDKIQVYKTLNEPQELSNSTNNIKIIKKKIIKGKSDNSLKIKKTLRIMKIDTCTIEGKSFKQKYNQENFFMKEQFLDKKEQFLIGICNGHGKNGKLISKYVINLLPKLITDTSDINIINSYLQMNKEIIIQNNKKFDCSLSGASCISLIVSLDKIISANLGDNKAILARYENGLYNFINLNREHRPTASDEKKRILEHKGKIGHLYENTNGPKKIFLKNSDIPGLSISRSFGDVIAHTVGVISEPEIKTFIYNGSEKFMILASHEFWKIINSEESVEIVKEFYENNMDAIGALNKLALEILKKCENENKSINEDITIIIVFFE